MGPPRGQGGGMTLLGESGVYGPQGGRCAVSDWCPEDSGGWMGALGCSGVPR